MAGAQAVISGHEDKGHTLGKADWMPERSGSLRQSCQTIPGLPKHSPNGETLLVLPEQKPTSQSMTSGGRMAGAWGGECEGAEAGRWLGGRGPSCLLPCKGTSLRGDSMLVLCTCL